MEMLYWAKNGVHAFGYNSVESEPIWTKFGNIASQMLGLALADFGPDPRSSGQFVRKPKFFVR